ncbi:MAG: glycine dehydrogenase subunit 1 [Chloroflexota bacterium]|jgi:glycine dehydrogenase subunit 1|nr:glycine dehydrogenase subunit 1 [Chloroflexota bacterium]
MSFVPLTEAERTEMLGTLGLADAGALFDVLPESIRFPAIDIGPALTEMEAVSQLEGLAARNTPLGSVPSFLGAGAYRHFIPSAVGAIMSRSEYGTSYTPYQPEVSQGTLQVMFEFQSLVCALTAMEVANASVYDGASALAEAALMAMRSTGRDRLVVSGAVHPHYRGVLDTYVGAKQPDITTSDVIVEDGVLVERGLIEALDEQTACCIVSQPTFFGEIRDLTPVVEAAHRVGALVVEVYNPTSLGILKPPGESGADIAVAEGQALGIPLSYGGPYVGLMSCRRELVRQLPGRIAGEARDAQGRRGFVLTLQAREQHIRREKATSNICTSQTWISLGVTAYLALLGPEGLRSVGNACHETARYAADRLAAIPGVAVVTPRPFFHEFAIRTLLSASELNRRLLERGIIGGFDLGPSYPHLADVSLLCCTELTSPAAVDALVESVRDVVRSSP